MDTTKILRRVLIAIIFIVLAANAYFYFAAEKEISKRKLEAGKNYNLSMLFYKKADADTVMKALTAAGVKPDYSYPVRDYKKEPIGYVAAQEFSKDESLEGIKKMLVSKGFRLKEEETNKTNNVRIYIDALYNSKADAAKLSDYIYEKTLIRFNVEEFFKKTPYDFHGVILTDIDKDEAKKILDRINKSYGGKFIYKLSKG